MSLAVLELVADESRRAPVLVSLDDLHWMDEPSVDLVVRLQSQSGQCAVVCRWMDMSCSG
jgi:predicted ATPase